jgi:hypothetical protein
MSTKLFLSIIPLLFAFAGSASAADWNAGDLKTLCKAQDKESDKLCSIYIAGVYDGFAGAQLMRQRGMASCMPAIGPGNARTIIEKYLDDHPDVLQRPVVIVAPLALISAFHCEANVGSR